jgi:ABC-type oligopeptide transport system ATPase subunit
MYFKPTVVYKDPNEERTNSIVRYIGSRVLDNNKNFLCALVGQTGSGKSWTGVSICEMYSKMFNIEFDAKVHIISSLKELLLLINDKEIHQKIKPGSIILFDEPQTEANSRTWQSDANQALNTLVSTFRNQRLVVLFATPYLEFIDKQSRILFHAEFKMLGYNKQTLIARVKPRFLEYATRTNQFYYKRLVVKYAVPGKEVFEVKKLGFWNVPKASDGNLIIYEAKKKAFSEELNRKLLNQVLLREKNLESKNKNEDFLKVSELYDKFGEDYLKISGELPHISPLVLSRYVTLVKKTRKAQK